MEFGIFVQQYGGWIGLLLYFLIKEFWPFLRDKVWPERSEKDRKSRERYRWLEEQQLKINERQVLAVESMSLSVQEMTLAIAMNNERLTQLIGDHTNHVAFVQEAITDMRVKIAEGHKDAG